MESDYIGYIKYSGALVEEGIIDARSGAKALTGMDRAIRHFVSYQDPALGTVDFPIPVRIQRGSWMAVIPQDVDHWIAAALGFAATTYASKAVGKVAENDFKEVKSKDIFRKAFFGIQWMVRIAKHLGSSAIKAFERVQWNGPDVILIPNGAGQYLEVPIEYFKMYVECPSSLLEDLVALVVPDRTMSVGVLYDGDLVEVSVESVDRALFVIDEDLDDEIVFPELVHGMDVQLEGIVTRGNEVTNSVGFRYHEHILNCIPNVGSIVRFKKHLFLACRIYGQVSRLDDRGHTTEKKPKILFDDLIILNDGQLDLIAGEKG